MTWPTGTASVVNVDQSTDSPANARPDIKDLFDRVNAIVAHVAQTFMQGFLAAATPKLAREALNIGKVLKPAHSATPTFDFSTGTVFMPGVITSNITSITVTNLDEGVVGRIRFKQNSAGNFTIAAITGAKISGTYGKLGDQVTEIELYNTGAPDNRIEGDMDIKPV